MQKISNLFFINFLKQDVLSINKKNKILQIKPIYFLMNLKQTIRLRQFKLPVGVYIEDKQCRFILKKFLNTTNVIFLSDNNFSFLNEKFSVVFFIQTSNFVEKNVFNNLNVQKNCVIKIHNQFNSQQIFESYYSILFDSFNIKNLFFLITFFRFFVKK